MAEYSDCNEEEMLALLPLCIKQEMGLPSSGRSSPLRADCPEFQLARDDSPMGSSPPFAPVSFMPATSGGQNAPCNTLFVGNLPGGNLAALKRELEALFDQPGSAFKLVSLETNPSGKRVCFVAFETWQHAAQALGLDGHRLTNPGSRRGGIKLEFAKNSFGRYENEERTNGDPYGVRRGGTVFYN